VSGPAIPDRCDVLALLAQYDESAVDSVPERIDSLRLAWLIHAIEEKYEFRLDLGDDQLETMGTVEGAVGVLRSAMDRLTPNRNAT
jgi:acyl carrier protein